MARSNIEADQCPKNLAAIAPAAGRAREQFGPAHTLDPFGVTGKRSAAFNPLDMLDANCLDVTEDANTLVDALVFDEPGITAMRKRTSR